jgi:hypothetical protein
MLVSLDEFFSLLAGPAYATGPAPETGHEHVDRVVKDLEAEGFVGTVTHFCPVHFQADFTNAATNEAATVECLDLEDPQAGQIWRGDCDLPAPPEPVALPAYTRPKLQ